MRRLVFDLETNGLLPELDRIHTLTIEDPDTGETWSCTDDHPDYTSIAEGLKVLQSADILIGHNIIDFDLPAIRKVYPKWTYNGGVLDTLVCTRLIWPDTYKQDQKLVSKGKLPGNLMKSHSLKAWGMRLGVMKDDYSGGWDHWNQEMQDYGEQDVRVTVALLHRIEEKKFSPRAIKLEHDFKMIISEQERYGFPFDFDAAVRLQGELAERRMELEEKLIDTFGSWWVGTPQTHRKTSRRQNKAVPKQTYRRFSEKTGKELKPERRHPYERCTEGDRWCKITRVTFNPGSRDHIAKVLKDIYGWVPVEKTDKGKPKVDESTLGGLNVPEAPMLIEYLTVKKLEGYLSEGANAWLRLCKQGADGVWRMHGQVITNGAVTGRCTHKKPNITQVPGNRKPWGKQCRSLFTASPGYVIVGADASGLELRCLAHYLGRWDDGNYVDLLLNGDAHQAMADAIDTDRDTAKTFTYAYL